MHKGNLTMTKKKNRSRKEAKPQSEARAILSKSEKTGNDQTPNTEI